MKILGVNETISWKEQIQFLDFKDEPASRKVSLEIFLNGDYKGVGMDRGGENSITTEKRNANRIKSWFKPFTPFNRFFRKE